MKSLFLIFLLNLTPYPNINCQTSVTLSNVQINLTTTTNYTTFVVTSSLGNGVSINDAWLGIGLNSVNRMSGTSVVVCRNKAGLSSVKHYYNSGYSSNLLDSSNQFIGLSETSVIINQNNIICSFKRANSNTNPKYYDLIKNNSPYIILAYGTGDIGYHAMRTTSTSTIKFSVVTMTTVSSTMTTTNAATMVSTMAPTTVTTMKPILNTTTVSK